jgi:hypothetical protein
MRGLYHLACSQAVYLNGWLLERCERVVCRASASFIAL